MTIAASSTLSRRDVLNGVAASSVVIVVGRLTHTEVRAQPSASAVPINAYVAIAPDGTVTLHCAHSEMGQGIYTTLDAIIVDVLEAECSKSDVVLSPAEPPSRHPFDHWQSTTDAHANRSPTNIF